MAIENLPDKQYLRVDEVAGIFRRSRRTVYRWILDGKLEAHKSKNGVLMVPTSAISQIIKFEGYGD